MKMKFVLMAFAAAGVISGSTLVLAETPVSPAAAEKIKATIEGFGCTGGKIEKADFGYEVDDVKCKDGQEYEIKLDPIKLIVMTLYCPRHPSEKVGPASPRLCPSGRESGRDAVQSG